MIAKVLFVVVAVTANCTELASIEHDELFPRLELWWHNNPPSPQFKTRAVEYLEELDNRRKQNLLHLRGKNAPIPCFLPLLRLYRVTTSNNRKFKTREKEKGPKQCSQFRLCQFPWLT
jgi:hypothetical protein